MARRAERPTPKWNPKTRSFNAFVTAGRKPNGRPLQVHVERAGTDARDQAAWQACDDEIERLWSNAKKGIRPEPGSKMSLPDWIDVYISEILPRRKKKPVSIDTLKTYRGWNSRWIRPNVTTAIGTLRPTSLERLYIGMDAAGLSGGSQRAVHFLIQGALKAAHRRGYCAENVALMIDAPEEDPPEIETFTPDERARIFAALKGRRTELRFIVGLVLAPRQGEVLGLQWSAVDYEETDDGGEPDAPDIRIVRQLVRRTFEHACGDEPCGKKRPVDCPKARLPLKVGEEQVYGGLVLKDPKAGSRRAAPMPLEIWRMFREHRRRWAAEKLAAGIGVWLDTDLVFVDELGRPIDPKADREEWRAILAAAKVPYRKLHTMRHDGATEIHADSELAIAQEILGHSSPDMTKRYVHRAEQLKSSPAARAATDSNVRRLWG